MASQVHFLERNNTERWCWHALDNDVGGALGHGELAGAVNMFVPPGGLAKGCLLLVAASPTDSTSIRFNRNYVLIT